MLENVYSTTHYTKIYDDKPADVEERFFEKIKQEINATKISDISLVVKDFDIPQGFWGTAKKVKLCEVSFKDTNLQKFRTYFNASVDGNAVLLSRPEIRLLDLPILNVLKLYKTKMGHIKSNTSKNRIFSTSLKESIVKDIEEKRTSVQDVVTLYSVSATSVYKWLAKYSLTYPQNTRMVVEQESEAVKTRQLMADKAELQRALGEKQMELDLLNKLIGVASERLQVDIKKIFFEKWSSGIG